MSHQNNIVGNDVVGNNIVEDKIHNVENDNVVVNFPTVAIGSGNVTVGPDEWGPTVTVGPGAWGTSTSGNSNQFTFSPPVAEPESLKDVGKEPNILKRIYMLLTRSVNETNYKHNFVSNTTTLYPGRYWSVIRVNEQGQVYFKVFRGWFGGRWLYRCGLFRGQTIYWESVPSREKLESTLGLTHLKIEEVISQDKKRHENIEFIKAICKTDPDNLKIIAELDKLDKGVDVSYNEGVAFSVSGSGTGPGP